MDRGDSACGGDAAVGSPAAEKLAASVSAQAAKVTAEPAPESGPVSVISLPGTMAAAKTGYNGYGRGARSRLARLCWRYQHLVEL